jgi:hypothetical protein
MVDGFCIPSSRAASSGPHTASVEQDVESGSVALVVSKRHVLKANRRLSVCRESGYSGYTSSQ